MKERKNMDKLKRTVQMLKKYPMQYLGVIGLDGKPKVKALNLSLKKMESFILMLSGEVKPIRN